MAEFSVYAGELLIGTTELERGDPPMGVAFGTMIPTEGYSEVKARCIEQRSDQAALNLSVRTSAGTVLSCVGVGISDLSDEAGEPMIDVEVLGIDHELYAKLFPGHLAAYQDLFRSPSGNDGAGRRGHAGQTGTDCCQSVFGRTSPSGKRWDSERTSRSDLVTRPRCAGTQGARFVPRSDALKSRYAIDY